MSRLILQDQPDVNTPELLHRLTEEFAHYNDPETEYHQPLVNIDQFGNRTRLLVIWDVWLTLSQEERSQLVLSAYEATHGEAAALDVNVSMGLTQDEAARLGIGFVPTSI